MSGNKGFSTSLGALITSIACAVGLGNLWKFPYEMGESGGALFLFGYAIVTIVICFPLMVAEFLTGRAGQSSNIIGIKKLAPNSSWQFIAILNILTNVLIGFFYVVVGGWVMYYLYVTVLGHINAQTNTEAYFNSFIQNKWGGVIGTIVFLMISLLISIKGVEKGLEKSSMYLMPFLGIFFIALVIYSFTLPNVSEAMHYIFKPDFSKFKASTMIDIISQAFFSLSLGVGVMTLYGSYMKKSDNLIKTAINTCLISAIVMALLSSILVFNITFSFGIPQTSGPGLIFMAFPKIFANMKMGFIIGIIFYLFVFLVAVTSMVALLEMPTAFLTSHFNISRRNASILCAIITGVFGIAVNISLSGAIPKYYVSRVTVIMAIIISLIISFLMYPLFFKHVKATYKKNDEIAKFYGIILSLACFIVFLFLFFYNKEKHLFSILDTTTCNLFIPIGGILAAVFCGWIIDKKVIMNELKIKENNKWYKIFIFLNKYFIPLVILIMLLFPFI